MSREFEGEALAYLKAGQSLFYVNTSGERRLVDAVRRVGWLWARERPAADLRLPAGVLADAGAAVAVWAAAAGRESALGLRDRVVPRELVDALTFLADHHPATADEEAVVTRGVTAVQQILNASGLPTFTWDACDGYQPPPAYEWASAGACAGSAEDALRALGAFKAGPDGPRYPFPNPEDAAILPAACLVVVKDAEVHLQSHEKPIFRRIVRSLYEDSRLVCQSPPTRRHVFFAQPHLTPPESVRHCLVRLPFAPPGEREIEAAVAATQQGITDPARRDCPPALRGELVRALRGLEQSAIETTLARCVVDFRGFVDGALPDGRRMVPAVRGMRSRMLSSGQGMRIYDPDDPEVAGLGELGGYENIKDLAADVLLCRTPEARAAGLKPPSGFGLAGPPGTGKTFCGKLFSRWVGVPLVVMNMGTAKEQWVGASEANMARNLATAKALGECVVLFDEWDKQAGGTVGGFSDGNTSGAMLSLVLEFAADPSREAFLVFTMNRLTGPIESLRAGRISDFFYTPLPGAAERAEIMRLKLREQAAETPVDLARAAADPAMEGLSGAELTEVVDKACRAAFRRCGRKAPTAAELLAARLRVTPVSRLNPEEVKAMEAFKDVAVPVGRPPAAAAAAGRRGGKSIRVDEGV